MGEKWEDRQDQALCQWCVRSVCSWRLMAPCSRTLQNLSGIQSGAPAGTLHPPRQGKHRGFMSAGPCMDLRILVKERSFPQTPCQAETWTSPPSPQSTSIYTPQNSIFFFFFFSFLNTKPGPSSLPWPTWPGDAPSLSHSNGDINYLSGAQTQSVTMLDCWHSRSNEPPVASCDQPRQGCQCQPRRSGINPADSNHQKVLDFAPNLPGSLCKPFWTDWIRKT